MVHTETRNNDVTWCQREVGCELRLDADVLAMIHECVAAARFVGTAQSGLSLLMCVVGCAVQRGAAFTMAACALPSFGVFCNSDLGKFACYKHGDIVW